jgi:hypothetical protein
MAKRKRPGDPALRLGISGTTAKAQHQSLQFLRGIAASQQDSQPATRQKNKYIKRSVAIVEDAPAPATSSARYRYGSTQRNSYKESRLVNDRGGDRRVGVRRPLPRLW